MVDTLSQLRLSAVRRGTLSVPRRTSSAGCQLQPLVEPQPSQM